MHAAHAHRPLSVGERRHHAAHGWNAGVASGNPFLRGSYDGRRDPKSWTSYERAERAVVRPLVKYDMRPWWSKVEDREEATAFDPTSNESSRQDAPVDIGFELAVWYQDLVHARAMAAHEDRLRNAQHALHADVAGSYRTGMELPPRTCIWTPPVHGNGITALQPSLSVTSEVIIAATSRASDEGQRRMPGPLSVAEAAARWYSGGASMDRKRPIAFVVS